MDIIISVKRKLPKHLFSVNVTLLFCWRFFFLANITAKTLSLFTSCDFSQADIIKFSIISSSASQSSLKFHLIFNNEKTCAETETKLDFISSIWDDDHILRLDENNWQCLWCTKVFQGINATKSLAHVQGKKGMHIKSCYVAMEKSSYNKIPKTLEFQTGSEGCSYWLFRKHQGINFKFTE